MKYEKISVVGAGAWGTAIANHIARLGLNARIWAYEKEVVDDINSSRRNSTFLEGVDLEPKVTATTDIASVCGAPIIFFVSPSHVMEGIVGQMVPHLGDDTIIVSCTKGIENKKLRLPSQVFDELLPEKFSKRLVCFSGPSFAIEVAKGLPTAITAASRDSESARVVQKVASGDNIRVYTHDDVIGVELGGVVKNVVAIAAGISDGLKNGHNTRAAIITRGLEEAVRLGRAIGADEKTFRGLSGIGDLVLTASGDLSRNRTVGLRLGSGEKLDDIVSSMRMVAEGVRTSKSIHLLSKKHNVEMPLCSMVYDICHKGKPAKGAVGELFSRSLKNEFDG